jgi:hypothetical protein
MGVIGIITCEILELEFVYILATDPEVFRVTVLEDARSARLIEALESRGLRNLRRIPHITSFDPEPSGHLEVVVRVLELALHRTKKILRRALIDAARELAPHAAALFLGYGLCGNALENPKELLDVKVPVFIPLDDGHPVDDCIGLLLGGRDCYYAEQLKVPGTFFMTPGWTCHWRRIWGSSRGAADKTLKRMFARYERSLLVKTPIMSEDDMQRNVEEFNQLLGLRVETRQGTIDMLSEAWQSAKAFLKVKAEECLRGTKWK